jgi:hypothetical protein
MQPSYRTYSGSRYHIFLDLLSPEQLQYLKQCSEEKINLVGVFLYDEVFYIYADEVPDFYTSEVMVNQYEIDVGIY